MCKLPDAVTNSEVEDLRERSERYIDDALRYACRSWHKHLGDEYAAHTPGITSALHQFLEKKFLFWLEVLSVLGAVRDAVDALTVAAKRVQVSHISTPDTLLELTPIWTRNCQLLISSRTAFAL